VEKIKEFILKLLGFKKCFYVSNKGHWCYLSKKQLEAGMCKDIAGNKK